MWIVSVDTGARFLHAGRVLGLVALQQLTELSGASRTGLPFSLPPETRNRPRSASGWDFQQPAIDEAQALLEPIEAGLRLPLGHLPERVVAAFSLPAEDDAVTAVVPFFQRGHASFPPQNRTVWRPATRPQRHPNVFPCFSPETGKRSRGFCRNSSSLRSFG